MTITAGFQQSVTPTIEAMPGDFDGIPSPAFLNNGYIGASAIEIGTFVWGVNTNPNQVTQLQGSNTEIAGIVTRQNANVMSWGDIANGWSLTIPLGYQSINVCAQGTLFVGVQVYGGGSIAIGMPAYIKLADGTTWVSASDPGAGYQATGWKIVSPTLYNTFSDGVNTLLLVKLSNVKNFGGQ